MKNVARIFAEKLLKISAIKLQPDMPFVWASGWNSPIYTDNRRTLSFPDVRTFIKIELTRLILEKFPQVECVAGVATGAIAQGALVADELDLPYAYVRSTPKDHGLENLIEGDLRSGSKVVVVEDLVSTGKSSLKAVEALRNAGCEVVGMVALFTYGFPEAEANFEDAGVELHTLSDYNNMLEAALATRFITESDIDPRRRGRVDPATGPPRRGQPPPTGRPPPTTENHNGNIQFAPRSCGAAGRRAGTEIRRLHRAPAAHGHHARRAKGRDRRSHILRRHHKHPYPADGRNPTQSH